MDSKVLESNLKVMELFRELDPLIPVTTVSTFLMVALNEGLTMLELETSLDISQSSCSRNILYLSEYTRNGNKPGLGLVKTMEDPLERRRKIAKLTPKGKKILDKIQRILN